LREEIAREILDGYGDATIGEWTEDRPNAFHLRRRLSCAEQLTVGNAIDLRGTPEALERFKRIADTIPQELTPLAMEELGEKLEATR
jgi:hypothetical protein